MVARAVGLQAIHQGLTPGDEGGFEAALASNIWEPVYLPYELDDDNRAAVPQRGP
jgi:malate dehydrogenase (oxaloacetate-decarboxylating)